MIGGQKRINCARKSRNVDQLKTCDWDKKSRKCSQNHAENQNQVKKSKKHHKYSKGGKKSRKSSKGGKKSRKSSKGGKKSRKSPWVARNLANP